MSGRRDTQGSACLFVGRLSKDTRAKDLEDVFYKYGKLIRCDVKYGEETRVSLIYLFLHFFNASLFFFLFFLQVQQWVSSSLDKKNVSLV